MSKAMDLSNYVTEDELANHLGLEPKVLGDLRRRKGLPYVVISRNKRVYYIPDVAEWLNENRKREFLDQLHEC